ncbi:hypothetical protein C8J57DRAFT_1289837 [Mycena rebaudengoi]|nr:hypothetical protein C8J57DRAFT_1289837 [Mycena rebaudengoi]
MEPGEIRDVSLVSTTPPNYDPSHEWPGDTVDAPTDPNYGNSCEVGSSRRPLFRLLVLRTSVLPTKQTLAITDGYTQLQFGRDVSSSQDVPRIRLKEMEVSKLHATVYWDNTTQWSIVDMGSKHGTFIQPASSAAPLRLSPPRVASVPRRLHHLDAFAIGSTTFLVHIHEGSPCAECLSTAQNEIPLFLSSRRKAAVNVPASDTSGYLPARTRDPKKALTTLKQHLLNSTGGPVKDATSYTDRSARRRSLYPPSRLDAPGVAMALRVESSSLPQVPPTTSESWNPPIQVTTSQPSAPLPATNVGHRLLMAQGWTPGSSLGSSWDEEDVIATPQRAGIGMPNVSTYTSSGGNWKAEARQRRWQDKG